MAKKPPILVVHPDTNKARAVGEILVQDYDVYVTKGPDRANEFLKGNPIDLVIASRDLTGIPTLEWFSRLALECPDVVRILLISNPMRAEEEDALANGTVHYLLREPVERAELKRVINGYFPTELDFNLDMSPSLSAENGLALPELTFDALQQDMKTVDCLSEPIPETDSAEKHLAASEESTVEDQEEIQLTKALLQETLDNLTREREEWENRHRSLQERLDAAQSRLAEMDETIKQLEEFKQDLAADRDRLAQALTQKDRHIAKIEQERSERSKPRPDRSRDLASREQDHSLKAVMAPDRLEILEIELKMKESEILRLHQQIEIERKQAAEVEKDFQVALQQCQDRYLALERRSNELDLERKVLAQGKIEVMERLAWFEARTDATLL